MKLHKLAGSLLTATALLGSVLPAHAGPFDLKAGGVFTNSAASTSTTTGNANNTTSSPNNTPEAGSEVNTLGTNQSWVDPKNLAKEPRALCNSEDLGLGNSTNSSSTKLVTAISSKSSSGTSSTHNDGGGGGGSFLGIGASGEGHTIGSNNQSQSGSQDSNKTQESSSSRSTVVVGKKSDCSAFVQSAAARDMNFQDNLTKRYEIKVGRRGQQVDNLLKENK